MIYNPAIIICAFNRPESFNRLLGSVQSAFFDTYPDLIISIDYSEVYSPVINHIASEFEWPGVKKIIVHQKNLGLREHILSCARLVDKYESLIILEDDLFVSPYFYSFAISALRMTSGNSEIAGVSMYSNSFNESSFLPFQPIRTNNDFFLMQIPCSWGQIWTKEQFNSFDQWYNTKFNPEDYRLLPSGIRDWSENSWKKPFFVYLIKNKKYFAYPYISFSQNLNEPGVNITSKDYKFLSEFASFKPSEMSFNPDSTIYYDASCNLLPRFFKENSSLKGYEFEVDFFGNKLDQLEDENIVLTCLPVSRAILSFGLEIRPIELNVLFNISGDTVFLAKKKDIKSFHLNKKIVDFYYPVPSWYYPFFTPSLWQNFVKKLLHIFKIRK